MRLFQSRYDLLKRASPVRPGKRFVSFFIDLMVVFIISTIFFFIGRVVVTSTDAYNVNTETAKNEVLYYNEFIEETHLVEFVDKETSERVITDRVIYKNVCRAIYYANEVSQTKFTLNDKVKEYGTSIDNDSIYLFYTSYVVNHNQNNQILDFNDKTATEYVMTFYKSYFGDSNYYQMFAQDNGTIPTLNINTAEAMHNYLFETGEEAQQELGKTYYSNFLNAYSTMLDVSENLMLKSEPYYTEHYLKYVEAITVQARLVNITLIICILIGSLVGTLVPKLLFKDETTIGRKLMGLGVIKLNDEQVKPYSSIITSVISMFGFLIASIFIYMLPPFYFNFNLMAMPFTANGSFSFATILLIVSIIGIINAIPALFMHYKTTIMNIILKTKVVDLAYLDEGDLDDPEEAKPL